MDTIRDFFGDLITKLNLGWLVEEFAVNSMAVRVGCAVILMIIVAVVVMVIRKKKQKKLKREDYKYCVWTLIYLSVALFVFNTALYGIGNSLDTLLYILLLIILPLILMMKYKNEQHSRTMKERELLECKRVLELQKEQIARSKELYENIRSMKHDLNDHIKTMEVLIANSKDRECAEYLEHIKANMEQTDMRNDTGNAFIDAIFTEMYRRARDKDIRLIISCEGRMDKLKDVLAVSVVLNNALNNALEACERVKEDIDKIVDVSLVCKKDVILIVKNSCDDVIMQDGELCTLKGDRVNHGIGMKNIESAVKALGGIMQWKHNSEAKQFTLMANWC